MRRAFAVLLFVSLSQPASADAPNHGKPALVAADLHPVLLKEVRRHPCKFLSVALAPEGNGKDVCSRLRHDDNKLIVNLLGGHGGQVVGLLKPGQQCGDGVLAVDPRPSRDERLLSYLEITLSGEDHKTLTFEGWLRTYSLLPNGKIGGEIGKGCGAELSGKMRLGRNGWHLVGERRRGCSE